MDDIWEEVQYEAFCVGHPMTFSDWQQLAVEWISGDAEINPYPLDEKEANKRIMEKLH